MLETLKREWKSATIWSIVWLLIEMYAFGNTFGQSLWLSCWFFGGYVGGAHITNSIDKIEDETKRKRYKTIYNVVIYSLLLVVILTWIF